jgi:hypothetical protein
MKLDSKYNYNVSGHWGEENAEWEIFITPEVRAYQSKYSDPLTLCFKLMIDFDKPYGLFASEDNVDSALAYLKRIGDVVRYEMLKHWIDIFTTFIRKYDFLITGCEGVDVIVNAKAHEAFTENDKITFNIRETSDMLVQSLLTQYRRIWYDSNRGVEVLPANLRRFDIFILIYNAGYYNMGLYDAMEANGLEYDRDVETKIYPTLKKLSEKYFVEKSDYKFNHHLIEIQDASINNEESGKSFFATLTNEQTSDYVKNTLVLNFRFASYKGIFNNIFGEFDFVKTLALAAAQDKFTNEVLSEMDQFTNKTEGLLQQFEETKDDSDGNDSKLQAKIKKRLDKYMNALLGPNTPIGNTLKDLTDPTYYKGLVNNTIDAGISKVEDKYIYGSIAKLNNLVMTNFSGNLFNLYNNFFGEEPKNPRFGDNNANFGTRQINPILNANINTGFVDKEPTNALLNTPIQGPNETQIVEDWKPIKFQILNIYDRKNF